MNERIRGWLAAIFLFLCVLLGGASAAGVLANAVLQALAVLLIVWVFWSARQPLIKGEAKPLLYMVAALVLFGVISLIPLPYGIWSGLPGREPVARGFQLLGIEAPAVPLSLTPRRTIAALLSLLPPLAMFLLVLRLSATWRRRLGWVLLGTAVLSIGLSAFQLLGGPQSSLRFYAITNPNRAVGFFSSANHLPTLLLAALPFAGVLAARAAGASSAQKRSGGLTASISVALFLIAGVAVSGSSAGYALLIPAALGSLLIHRRSAAGQLSRYWGMALGATAVLFIGFAAFGPLNQQTLSGKFSDHPTSRGTIWETTSRAVAEFLPVGSGWGSFGDVYRTFDNPDRTTNEFVNHAHNDYLEVALDLGAFGVILIAAFLLWWAWRSLAVWREDFKGANIARCGSVMITVLLLHSAVDYPLRTASLAVIFALACAFMVSPPARESRKQQAAASGESGLRHLEAD